MAEFAPNPTFVPKVIRPEGTRNGLSGEDGQSSVKPLRSCRATRISAAGSSPRAASRRPRSPARSCGALCLADRLGTLGLRIEADSGRCSSRRLADGLTAQRVDACFARGWPATP